MNKPFKHHVFVQTAINGGASRARFSNREERDLFFAELVKHYGVEPQLKNGVNPYIAVLKRNKQGVVRLVCTDKFVRGAGNEAVNAFDVDFEWVACYREQDSLAEAFGLDLRAFTPKSLR